MKNILVPTDFSDCARAAEDCAIELAKKSKSEIHFLHLLLTPVDWVKLPLEREKLFPEVKSAIGFAKNELSKLQRRAEKEGLKVKINLIFDKGREEIYSHIKNHQHDFVVMGSHGTKGIKEIIGSNTQRVVRYSNVPVLVIKNKVKKLDFKNIVFASTFEEDVIKPFKIIMEFSAKMNSNIHLVFINTPYNFKETNEVEKNMSKFVKKFPNGKFTLSIYNALQEDSGIQNFSNEIKANLISITTHGKKGFLQIMSPSITESLVNHSSIPVLSINMKSI